MRAENFLAISLFVATLFAPLIPAFGRAGQDAKPAAPAGHDLPPGEGKDLLVKDCQECHQLSVVTSQRHNEAKWADLVEQMRSRGANGSDEDMDQIVHYLTTNFGPVSSAPVAAGAGASAMVNVNSAAAADLVAGLSLSQANADAIVEYRSKNGKFKDVAGLKQVPGVDGARIDAVKDRIAF